MTVSYLQNMRDIINDLNTAIAGGGGGGATTWGSITGTLSSQTDLQTALNGKQAAGSYAASSHGHAIADVTGLQDELDDLSAAMGGSVDGGSAASTYTTNQMIDGGGA